MSSRKHSVGPEALLFASLVAGCVTPPLEGYRLPTGTTSADFLQEVYKAAALEAKSLQHATNTAETSDSSKKQAQRQLKAVYHYFSWQHPERRTRLIEMLKVFERIPDCSNRQQMQNIIDGLEQLSEQLAMRDAELDARGRR